MTLIIEDIETIMDDIAVLAKVWIPYYCYEINQEKGDTLLGELELLTSETQTPIQTAAGEFIVVSGTPGNNGFYSEGYHTWYMTDDPVYRVEFLQAIMNDPIVIANPQGYGEITRYSIGIMSFVRETFDKDEMPRIKARYNRMFRRLLSEQIIKRYPSVGCLAEKAIILEDDLGTKYELSGVTFSVDVIY